MYSRIVILVPPTPGTLDALQAKFEGLVADLEAELEIAFMVPFGEESEDAVESMRAALMWWARIEIGGLRIEPSRDSERAEGAPWLVPAGYPGEYAVQPPTRQTKSPPDPLIGPWASSANEAQVVPMGAADRLRG